MLAASAAAVILGVVALQKPETVRVAVPIEQPLAAPIWQSYAPIAGYTGRRQAAFDRCDKSSRSELDQVPADARSAMTAGGAIAVSVEPIGGSPTGAPTGPVILTGKVVSA